MNNCSAIQEEILKSYDDLNVNIDQELIRSHIENCDECKSFAKKANLLEEGMILLFAKKDEDTKLKTTSKNRKRWYGLIAAIVLILGSTVINNTPVKASIEKALNLVLFEKINNVENELEAKGIQGIKVIEKSSNGKTLTSYLSGNKERTEHGNGNYTISNGKLSASFDKKMNIFLIEKNTSDSSISEKQLFKDLDPSYIKNLGQDQFLDRKIEKYQINMPDETPIELWFDIETDLLMREIEIHPNNVRIENSNIIELEFDANFNENIFDIKPPEGANVIDASDPKSMTVEQKKEYELFTEKTEANPEF